VNVLENAVIFCSEVRVKRTDRLSKESSPVITSERTISGSEGLPC